MNFSISKMQKKSFVASSLLAAFLFSFATSLQDPASVSLSSAAAQEQGGGDDDLDGDSDSNFFMDLWCGIVGCDRDDITGPTADGDSDAESGSESDENTPDAPETPDIPTDTSSGPFAEALSNIAEALGSIIGSCFGLCGGGGDASGPNSGSEVGPSDSGDSATQNPSDSNQPPENPTVDWFVNDYLQNSDGLITQIEDGDTTYNYYQTNDGREVSFVARGGEVLEFSVVQGSTQQFVETDEDPGCRGIEDCGLNETCNVGAGVCEAVCPDDTQLVIGQSSTPLRYCQQCAAPVSRPSVLLRDRLMGGNGRNYDSLANARNGDDARADSRSATSELGRFLRSDFAELGVKISICGPGEIKASGRHIKNTAAYCIPDCAPYDPTEVKNRPPTMDDFSN